MQLFNTFPKYLTEFKYAGLNLNEAPKEIEQYTLEFSTLQDKKSKETPTNQIYLIYCDWKLLLFHKEKNCINYLKK